MVGQCVAAGSESLEVRCMALSDPPPLSIVASDMSLLRCHLQICLTIYIVPPAL